MKDHLLNGQLATVAMDLEGLELPMLVVVDGHPLPIGLALLLGAENGVLANCPLRPAKANVLLGSIACDPLRYLLLGRGSNRGVFWNIAVRIGAILLLVLTFICPLAIGVEGRESADGTSKKGCPSK
jgi:hypothetical protein